MSDPILYEYVLAPGSDGQYGMLPGGQPPRASIAFCPMTGLSAVATESDEKSQIKRDKLALARLQLIKRALPDYPSDLTQLKDIVVPKRTLPGFLQGTHKGTHCPKCGGLGQRMTREARRQGRDPVNTVPKDWEPCPYCSWRTK